MTKETFTWLFLRIFVPAAPVAIQYGLSALGAYAPPFPQPTYILLLFSLSLVTLTEWKDFRAVVSLCVAPALVGAILYTVHLTLVTNQTVQERTMYVGFALWAFLLIVNTFRVLSEGIVQYVKGRT